MNNIFLNGDFIKPAGACNLETSWEVAFLSAATALSIDVIKDLKSV